MLRFLLLLSLFCTSVVAAQKNAEKKYLKAREARMVLLDSGTVQLIPFDYDGPLRTIEQLPSDFKVGAFYIGAYEVSNFDYLEYLYYLSRTNTDEYTTALPDTSVWDKTPLFSNAYLDYYLRHPAFRYYPLVGVTHQQAERYCAWLTDRYNENPERKHKKVRFRLPTKNEWTYAALSGANYHEPKKGATTSILYRTFDSPFPWSQKTSRGFPHSMLSENGDPLANFKLIDQSSVRYAEGTLLYQGDTIKNGFYLGLPDYVDFASGILNDGSDFTAPVYSFFPGLSGLYNMAGNVEELVAEYGITKGGSWDDTGYYLQNTTEETYDTATETSPFRGFRLAMDVIEDF